MVAKIFIDGEAGTTGLQIRDRLAARYDIQLLSLDNEHRKDRSARQDALNSADVAILCLPDDAARESVTLIESETTKVIDASTAHRTDPDWTYGFAEMAEGHDAVIAESKRVSNPGCYPQGLIATIRPLIDEGFFSPDSLISMNAISGYSGGGRKMIEQYEAAGAKAVPYLPYGLSFEHKHLPEMTVYSGLKRAPLFQPAVGNYAQGMLTLVPLHYDLLPEGMTGARIHTVLRDRFTGTGFVDVAPLNAINQPAELDPQALNSTNLMRLFVFANDQNGQMVVAALYDNLGKGASGAAVQNLNLMLGCNVNESLGAKAA
ncbi:MAG: N-acetyl-gamma-glutamyl-phosphate reductase [Stappiaceae bacterium]